MAGQTELTNLPGGSTGRSGTVAFQRGGVHLNPAIPKKVLERTELPPNVHEKQQGHEGWPADAIFGDRGEHGYSLEEIAVLPGLRLAGDADDIVLETRLSRSIKLPSALVGLPSPEVCGVRMAIALAQAGGIGVIHRHQSVKEQCEQLQRVKLHTVGFILDPYVLGPKATVRDLRYIKAERGASAIPITKNGRLGGELVGLVTSRDWEHIDNLSMQVHQFMTVDIVYATEPISVAKARKMMIDKKLGKLPVVNQDRELVAFMSRGDVKRASAKPGSSKDHNGQLLVAGQFAANDEDDYERARELVAPGGADALFMDLGDGGVTDFALNILEMLKGDYAATDIIAGPVSSCQQAKLLLEAGADGLLVGGPCAERNEATCLYEIAKFARSNYGMPCVADIGVRTASEMVKAVCLGASTVGITELLDGTEEMPGDFYFHDGVRVKTPQVSEVMPLEHDDPVLMGGKPVYTGLQGKVVTKGSAYDLAQLLIRGLKTSLQLLGAPTARSVSTMIAQGSLRFERQLSVCREEPRKFHRFIHSALHSRW
eukprot:TRINITY_DN31089_c0_g1_i1.p1 TRINITY_DN31089_c0_g1~~TRINITY_DN31089_c0_g1_i1.p1  ORF type:complete len:542 (-),score=105.71 TRINITY_DN31089_c0_g1_i1:31-1656(-)